MKVLIDECAPRTLKHYLAARGHECLTVQEASWSGARRAPFVLGYPRFGRGATSSILDIDMPPSVIFQLFKRARCRKLQISVTLNVPRTVFAKLKRKKNGRSEDFWFATTYPGEGKRKVAVSVYLGPEKKTDKCDLTMFWFVTEQDPPPEFRAFADFETHIGPLFGEREVSVAAEFSFNKNQIVSLFKPIEMGEQSQILDEIVGFTGVKRDLQGNILYEMKVAINDTSIEQKLSFRQTVRLEEGTPSALLETASKLSALAIKPKEAA